MNPFGIKTEDCNPTDWATGCGYRLPTIGCSGMSTFEQLKQSVEKAKAVLTAEVVASTRDTRNYFSASFSALPSSVSMGMGMNFTGGNTNSSSNGGSSGNGSSNVDLNLHHHNSNLHHSHHHHSSLHQHHTHTPSNLFADERLGGAGVVGNNGIEVSTSSSASDKRPSNANTGKCLHSFESFVHKVVFLRENSKNPIISNVNNLKSDQRQIIIPQVCSHN